MIVRNGQRLGSVLVEQASTEPAPKTTQNKKEPVASAKETEPAKTESTSDTAGKAESKSTKSTKGGKETDSWL